MASKTFGIIASGPSATAQDANKLWKICDKIIVINDSWRLCKDADYLYGTDMRWWKWALPDVIRDFDGELWTQRVQWTEEPEKLGINCFESEHKPGLCDEPGKIHTGQNSGFAAINAALHFGAELIYLLGYDMDLRGNQRHHNAVNRPENLNVASNYNDFCRNFATIDVKQHGIEIINLSRRTALNCFPLGELDELCPDPDSHQSKTFTLHSASAASMA